MITVFLAESHRDDAGATRWSTSSCATSRTGSARLATRGLDDAVARQSAEVVRATAACGRWRPGTSAGRTRSRSAHWLARISLICLLAPPPGDLLDALDALLLPVLDPDARDSRDRPDATADNPRSITVFDTVIRGGTIVDGTGADAVHRRRRHRRRPHRRRRRGRRSGPRGDRRRRRARRRPASSTSTPTTTARSPGTTRLEPSATNGITTVVLGNCGVGFAPVRPADHEQLIDMMEGVEDIPGAALTDGMPWGEWETFADYLDVIDGRRYAANVACHIAHGPVRYYVMGERAYEDLDATPDEVGRDGPHRARRRSTPARPASRATASGPTCRDRARSCPAPSRREPRSARSRRRSGEAATA